jgi:site-specific recombinase XerD
MDAWDDSLAEFAVRLGSEGGRAGPLAPRTRAAYLKDARLVARWLRANGVVEPRRITPTALEAAFRALGWAKPTRARALVALRRWLEPDFPADRSPADLLDTPRHAPPPVPRLSQAEAAALVESMGEPVRDGGRSRALALRDRAIVELLYGSGLRRQEACDLLLAGLDFEHETVRVVGKGGRARTVPMTEPSLLALRDYLADGRPRLAARRRRRDERERVFLSRTGRPLDGSTVYRVVAQALRRRGRAGGPHLLRHAAGTHLLEGPGGRGGAHLRVVQEVLGHASLATTQRYTGVTTRAMQDALRRGHPRG